MGRYKILYSFALQQAVLPSPWLSTENPGALHADVSPFPAVSSVYFKQIQPNQAFVAYVQFCSILLECVKQHIYMQAYSPVARNRMWQDGLVRYAVGLRCGQCPCLGILCNRKCKGKLLLEARYSMQRGLEAFQTNGS